MLTLTKLVRYIAHDHHNNLYRCSDLYLLLNHEYIGIKFNPALHHMENDTYIYFTEYAECKNYTNNMTCSIKINGYTYYCYYLDKTIIIEKTTFGYC